jgi:CheY-like chemotaxis protein
MSLLERFAEQDTPYRVLLVDDEPGQRYLQAEILSPAHFEVVEAGDGRLALAGR